MNQITTRYITENGACYEQYVISDPAAKTELVITPERGGMITGFSLNGEEYIWTRHPNFSECNRPRFGVPDRRVAQRGPLRRPFGAQGVDRGRGGGCGDARSRHRRGAGTRSAGVGAPRGRRTSDAHLECDAQGVPPAL